VDSNFDPKFYRERWKAVEEVEQIGLSKFNLIMRLLICCGLKPDKDVDKMQVILRWAKLKELYEKSKRVE
jgi:hypothetical protein